MIFQCLLFVIRLCSQKKSSNICATRIRNKINKELDKKVSNDMFSLRRLILISAPASESRWGI